MSNATAEQYEVLNRWTGEVQFRAKIEVKPDMTPNIKLGLAVQWASKNGANLRGADLQGADLRDANLRGADLQEADLRGADLQEADLRDANLRGADLQGADLRGAYLRGAYLRGANLSVAEQIPKIKNIHTAVYEASSEAGALDMSVWHKMDFCGTTHCRAGWVNHLAGEGGRVLEDVYGPSVAAALIYMSSDPSLEQIPNWLASNEEALADMKNLADAEVAK